MSVDVNIDPNVELEDYDCYVGEIQSNLSIEAIAPDAPSEYQDLDGIISGTLLKKANNYYIAIKASVSDVDDAEIIIAISDGEPVSPDSRGIAVLHVSDKYLQTVDKTMTVVASKKGYKQTSKTYGLYDLVLNDE